MRRRDFLPTALSAAAVPPARPMNVLHVIADQHQAACLGVEGHPQAITPNLDRLAAQGTRFTRAYTQNPICTPSRVSILSGQYCHNHGYYGLSGPAPQLEMPSFLSHFRGHGYRTAAIGKLHTPDEPRNWLAQHTDLMLECYGYRKPDRLGKEYAAYLKNLGLLEKEDSVALPEFPGNQQHEGRPSQIPYRHSVEGWCVTRAIEFINTRDPRPFCMQVSLPRPHQCYTPDRRFWEMYPDDLALPRTIHNSAAHRPPHFQKAVESLRNMRWLQEPKTFEAGCRRVWHGYLGAITQVDFALGELLDHLERAGLAENTIVIYNADHGAYSGTFGVPEKAPGICSEAVCRVPMIWRVPGRAPAVVKHFVENVDVAPTLAALCGLPPMETADGRDISGDQSVRDVAVTENVWSKALRWGPWRFVSYPKELFDADIGELYNVDNDPDETRNLYHDSAHQSVVSESRRLLLEWLVQTTHYKTVWPPGKTRRLKERGPYYL